MLGVVQGPASSQSDHFCKLVEKASTIHQAIDGVSDPAVELILKRKCADVGKVMFTLRASGDSLDEAHLQQYDNLLRESVGRSLSGDVGDDA